MPLLHSNWWDCFYAESYMASSLLWLLLLMRTDAHCLHTVPIGILSLSHRARKLWSHGCIVPSRHSVSTHRVFDLCNPFR